MPAAGSVDSRSSENVWSVRVGVDDGGKSVSSHVGIEKIVGSKKWDFPRLARRLSFSASS